MAPVPEGLHEFQVFERAGIHIGIIGLVEKCLAQGYHCFLEAELKYREWISTVSSWPPNFKYRDMETVGKDLSRHLQGEHRCDLIIALTHSRSVSKLLSKMSEYDVQHGQGT